MMKYNLAAVLILLSLCSEAQDTLSGYSAAVKGETLTYISYTPMATQALLTRTNTGEMPIEWTTEPVPAEYKGDTVYFTWVGGNARGTLSGDAPFDFSINGQYELTITLHKGEHSRNWFFSNDKGVSVRFQRIASDVSGDVSGKVTLAVPRSMCTPGQPLDLSITGQKKNSQDWLMVYKYRISLQFVVEALPMLQRSAQGDTLRMLRLFGTYKKGTGNLHVVAGKGTQDFPLHSDYNEMEMAVPYHAKDKSVEVDLSVEGKPLLHDTIALSELEPLEINLVHHSHTDIGYSNLQQEVAAIQIRNLKRAIELINKTKDYPKEAQYRWNVESLWAVENFLDSASADDVKAFSDALATGRLALQAGYANELTALMDGEETTWLTAYARRLEDRFHTRIRTAMITDVPGYTWSFIGGLASAGVKYFSIGPNNFDRIGGVISDWSDKPFYWTVPGGGKVLVDIAGSGYAWFHGTPGSGDPKLLTQRLLSYVKQLNDEKYPYYHALVRYNIVSDNAPLDSGISDFIKSWNEKYIYPKLVLSTPEIALSAIEKDYGSKLPRLKGDMSPYWEDGAASTALELGWNRRVRAGLEQTEALQAMLEKPAQGKAAAHLLPAENWYNAWRGVVMFDEHTWGAWNSVSDPDQPFVTEQWKFKRDFLVTADSLERSLHSTLLSSANENGNTYRAVNTHSWEVSGYVEVPGVSPKEKVVDEKGNDLHYKWMDDGTAGVYISRIPAYGSVVLKVVPQKSTGGWTTGEAQIPYTYENSFLKITIDSLDGSIKSMVRKDIGTDIVSAGPYRLNEYQYVPGLDPAAAEGARLKGIVGVDDGPLMTRIKLDLEAPGARTFTIEYQLDKKDGSLTIIDSVDKEKVRTKEAVHFAFPFAIPGANLLADNGAFPYRPFVDTLVGGNRDYGYIGKWMDLSNAQGGVMVYSQETPIMEWGSLRSEVYAKGSSRASWKTSFAPTQTLFSYAMNNYWYTNYKADQEGWASFTYKLMLHGPQDKAWLYKRAEEAEQPLVLLHTAKPLPGNGFIHVSNPNIVVSTLMPGNKPGTWWVELYNPTDKPGSTAIGVTNKAVYRTNIHQDRLTALTGQPITLDGYARVSLLLVDKP